jgi:hypothetical protein
MTWWLKSHDFLCPMIWPADFQLSGSIWRFWNFSFWCICLENASMFSALSFFCGFPPILSEYLGAPRLGLRMKGSNAISSCCFYSDSNWLLDWLRLNNVKHILILWVVHTQEFIRILSAVSAVSFNTWLPTCASAFHLTVCGPPLVLGSTPGSHHATAGPPPPPVTIIWSTTMGIYHLVMTNSSPWKIP